MLQARFVSERPSPSARERVRFGGQPCDPRLWIVTGEFNDYEGTASEAMRAKNARLKARALPHSIGEHPEPNRGQSERIILFDSRLEPQGRKRR
ncbi:hypothetical protein SAMN05444166_7649 [Singulisphaera sp. GP187]|nr:hypothetical protein SAMN05444166_7649 [Singulisphaera sp. GP187]